MSDSFYPDNYTFPEVEIITTLKPHLVGLLATNQTFNQILVFYGSLAGSIVCGLGFIASLISLVVFAQSELKGVLFKYYLTESLLNTLSAFINVFLIFIYKDYSSTPPFKMPEQVALWNLIFFDLVTNFCTFGSSVISIAISLDRYLSIINKRNNKIFNWKYSFHLFIVIMFVLSFVCSSPRPIQTAWLRFLYDVDVSQRPVYDEMHTVIQWIQTTIETIVRDLGSFIVLNILNVLLVMSLRKFIAKKKTIAAGKSSGEHKSEVDVTKMVIYSTLVYFVGRIGSMVYHISVLVPNTKSISYFKLAQYISLGCSYLFNIFIYYSFNKAFKKNFWILFGRIPGLGKIHQQLLKTQQENSVNNSQTNQTQATTRVKN